MVPILAKVLEKIVSVQLIQYLEKNNLLHPHQGAFCCGKSTEDILLLTVDHIVNTLGEGKSLCAAFLDLKKAFDSLDHRTLLQRIGNLSVAGSVLRWFKNYLSGRVHRVKLHNQFSEWREMKGGIPQGSALGPLLFVIYMNNLPLQITDGLLVQYADDTTLVCSGSTPSAAAAVLNSQLKLVHNWIRNSKMSLNHSKSSVMWFKTKSKRCLEYPNILIHDTILKSMDKQKYLGISGVAKGGPGRAQALPNACCALPPRLQ